MIIYIQKKIEKDKKLKNIININTRKKVIINVK